MGRVRVRYDLSEAKSVVKKQKQSVEKKQEEESSGEKKQKQYEESVDSDSDFDEEELRHNHHYDETFAESLAQYNPHDEIDDSEDDDKIDVELLRQYNEQVRNSQETNYGSVKVIKSNVSIAGGFIYYITFEAKNAVDGKTQTFQAEVFDGVEENKVVSCRIRPSA